VLGIFSPPESFLLAKQNLSVAKTERQDSSHGRIFGHAAKPLSSAGFLRVGRAPAVFGLAQ
jgi:hypothetical protein